ncbi:MAG: hypothetical protein F6K41_06840 [Symploca sp. SIO3E6]|nr:hypothetical protein [Caldora sp. SIO3E6]
MFSYKRFSFFLGLNLIASTVVAVNQVQAQSLLAENLLDSPKTSQSASEDGSSVQSDVDTTSSSNLDDGSRVNHQGLKDQLGERDNFSTFISSTIDIISNLGDSTELSVSLITEVEKERNPETPKPQVNELQEQNNSETSTSTLVEETEGSIPEKSASFPSELINHGLTGDSTPLVTEPKTEKIPEASPSLLVWLGLAGVGLLHASVRRQKAGGRRQEGRKVVQ